MSKMKMKYSIGAILGAALLIGCQATAPSEAPVAPAPSQAAAAPEPAGIIKAPETVEDQLAEIQASYERAQLTNGAGAPLMWTLKDSDTTIYLFGTVHILRPETEWRSPAFEAALFCGVRLAGDASSYDEPLKKFARHLGVAFQILNDLQDWQGDHDNKMLAGGDVLGGRPTLLWALALEGLGQAEQTELLELVADDSRDESFRLNRVRQLYQQADAFEKANRLIDKYQARAESIADEIEPLPLRRLLYFLIDTVLTRPQEDAPNVVSIDPPVSHTSTQPSSVS